VALKRAAASESRAEHAHKRWRGGKRRPGHVRFAVERCRHIERISIRADTLAREDRIAQAICGRRRSRLTGFRLSRLKRNRENGGQRRCAAAVAGRRGSCSRRGRVGPGRGVESGMRCRYAEVLVERRREIEVAGIESGVGGFDSLTEAHADVLRLRTRRKKAVRGDS